MQRYVCDGKNILNGCFAIIIIMIVVIIIIINMIIIHFIYKYLSSHPRTHYKANKEDNDDTVIIQKESPIN